MVGVVCVYCVYVPWWVCCMWCGEGYVCGFGGVQWVWYDVCGVVSSMCVVCVHVVWRSGDVMCVVWCGWYGVCDVGRCT